MLFFKKIFKIIIFIGIFLLTLEIFLQIGSFVISFKYKAKCQLALKEKSLRIMFIGDSWTQGADAPPKLGYVDLTSQALKKLFPDKDIQVYNFAWGSTNSSQAVHQFLDNRTKVKPHILVVMTGANNPWNTQDVLTADKRIRNEISDNVQKSIKFEEWIANRLKSMRIVKLYNLILYNICYKNREVRFPFGKVENEYINGYSKILSETNDREIARSYLIKNFQKADYDTFFKLIEHSFGNFKEAYSYLKNKGLWRPLLLKEKEYLNVEEMERRRKLAPEILNKNLSDLKILCDQDNVVMIIENYPHLGLFESVNRPLQEIATTLKVTYVDHYRYFKEKVGDEEWNKVVTVGRHVDYKGHEHMARNLIVILSNVIKNFVL